MAKTKGTRREKRLARRAQREREAEHTVRATNRRKALLIGIAAVTVLGGLGLHQAELPTVWLGLLLLVGCGAWLTVALGALGGGVKPRDRGKAGNIDYGN